MARQADPVGYYRNETTERTITADVDASNRWLLYSSSGTVFEDQVAGSCIEAFRAAALALDAEHRRMQSVGQTVGPITWMFDRATVVEED